MPRLRGRLRGVVLVAGATVHEKTLMGPLRGGMVEEDVQMLMMMSQEYMGDSGRHLLVALVQTQVCHVEKRCRVLNGHQKHQVAATVARELLPAAINPFLKYLALPVQGLE